MLQMVMSRFSVEIFCLTVPKNFVEEPFCAVFQKTSGSEKVYGKEGEGVNKLLSKISCLKVPKDFVEEPFSLSLISGIGKIYASEEYVTIFPRKLFVSKCRKISYRNLLVFHYFRVSNKFMVQRVMSRFSVEMFCLTVPKNFVEEPFCAVFQKTSGTEKVYG